MRQHIAERCRMDLPIRRFADVVVAAPSGRIDFTNAEAFKTALWPALAENRADRGAVVLDFGNVHYISSVGLRVLMLAAKEMHREQRKIAIAGAQQTVREILAISRFNMILAVFTSLRDALEQISPGALAAYDARGLKPS